VSSDGRQRLRRVLPVLPLLGLLVLALALWVRTIGDRTRVQVEDARSSAERELSGLAAFARSQSAAFASTSFIGYSVGRYYGFAQAYAQISPDPERAATLLRNSYTDRDTVPAELPPALAAYDAVHARFHASFQDLLGSTVFDDLYLIDRFGRVVYSLRKDPLFAADLSEARLRTTPLGELLRDVQARLPQAEKPQEAVVISQPKRLGETAAILIARPIVRHGSVEGVVAFRLPLAEVERRFQAMARPGLRFQLLDAAGEAVVGDAPRGETVHGPFTVEGTGWSYSVVADGGALGGGTAWLAALLLLAGLGAAWWAVRESGLALAAPAPQPTPAAPLPAPAPVPVPLAVQDEAPAPPVHAQPAHSSLEEELPPPAGDAPPAAPELASVPAELPDGFESDEEYRRRIVDVMTAALDAWHRAKGKGKIELAEESGLWRVYMDRSSLQTRTLDKYLLVETLPRNPRWRDVVRTAEYVLRHCPEPTPEREALQGALLRLKHQLREAERI